MRPTISLAALLCTVVALSEEAVGDYSAKGPNKSVAGVGLVLVDVRANGTVGNGDGYVMRWFQQVQITAPRLPIELWTGQTSNIPLEIQQHIANRSSLISVHRMPLRNAHKDVPQGLDLNMGNGGHVGKAFALSHSKFDFPVLTDSDVFMCNGWIEQLYATMNANPNADLIWTFPKYPMGVLKHDNTSHVSKIIDIPKVQEQYSQFTERNSGTVVAVRKTRETKLFLDDVLSIFWKMVNLGLMQKRKQNRNNQINKNHPHGNEASGQNLLGTAPPSRCAHWCESHGKEHAPTSWNKKCALSSGSCAGCSQCSTPPAAPPGRSARSKFVGSLGEKIEHDQVAFREAYFVHRHGIPEVVMPAGSKSWACRPSMGDFRNSGCGACGDPCLMVHSRPCFAIMSEQYSPLSDVARQRSCDPKTHYYDWDGKSASATCRRRRASCSPEKHLVVIKMIERDNQCR